MWLIIVELIDGWLGNSTWLSLSLWRIDSDRWMTVCARRITVATQWTPSDDREATISSGREDWGDREKIISDGRRAISPRQTIISARSGRLGWPGENHQWRPESHQRQSDDHQCPVTDGHRRSPISSITQTDLIIQSTFRAYYRHYRSQMINQSN